MSRPAPSIFADQLLKELGMNSPEQIDIDAIAAHLGAITCYEALSGCDGRVIGRGDSAIITINNNSTAGRQRFTAAHEVGHWIYDRGAATSCSAETIEKGWRNSGRETRANRFASAILLPDRMLKAHVGSGHPNTFEKIGEVAKTFRTSLTATAIKVTENSDLPLMVVCMQNGRRQWFACSKTVPDTLWPVEKLHPHGYATQLLLGEKSGVSGITDADTWFDTPRAHEHEVFEDSALIIPGLTLTLISWPCEDMLVEFEED